MTTPVFDFVKKYSENNPARFHMPGHKGASMIGIEPYDITEISGADVLYSADGIINESENNLSLLYGSAHSFYSTEGSTLAIKAMLALVSERKADERVVILAARNVHASFVRAAALIDLDVEWIYPNESQHLCKCNIAPEDVRFAINKLTVRPRAVYVTSPDYLGNTLDIAGISSVCREFGIPLLVDNAHGAYLKFLSKDVHPITLGAAMCADSAHKTLPVLTGGAYLHISKDYAEYTEKARGALSLFASTSPSYLTLCSLDLCNKRLSRDYPNKINALAEKSEELKKKIASFGFKIGDSEPLKIVINQGENLSKYLGKNGIEVEFADAEWTVLMLSPENGDADFDRLISALEAFEDHSIEKKEIHITKPHKMEMSIRRAVFSSFETVSAKDAVGRICSSVTVSCPPAVPIVISGERITEDDVALFKHYNISKVNVVKQGFI